MKKALISLALAALTSFASEHGDKIHSCYSAKGEDVVDRMEYTNPNDELHTIFGTLWEAYNKGDAQKVYEHATYRGFETLEMLDEILSSKPSFMYQPVAMMNSQTFGYSIGKIVFKDKTMPHTDDIKLLFFYKKIDGKWKLYDNIWYEDKFLSDKNIIEQKLKIKPQKPLF